MFLKMIQVILLLICLIVYGVSAQTDYVVLAKGDTLYGVVKFQNFSNNQQIQITDGNGKKVTYGKMQVRSFRQEDDVYHTIRTSQGYSIMKPLKEGYLSLYAFQIENQATWDGRYLTKMDGSGMEAPNLLFKKTMGKFLADCPAVCADIEKGTLTRNQLGDIIDRYNTCITSQASPDPITQPGSTSGWADLEQKVQGLSESEDRTTALEIIHEIRLKIQRSEKIPRFMITGLRHSLTNYPEISAYADTLLSEL